MDLLRPALAVDAAHTALFHAADLGLIELRPVLCADASTPHLLIAGQAGSGKSVLIQSIVASLVQFHDPGAIRFTPIDPKRVTFVGAGFRTAVAAHLDGPVRFDVEEVLPVIERLVEVMDERYRLFELAQVVDLSEYNEQVSAHSASSAACW